MPDIKYLNEKELKKFFDSLGETGNLRDLLMMKLCYHHGLRVSELVNLKVADFQDLGINSELFIRRVKGGLSLSQPMTEGDIKLIKRHLRQKRSNNTVTDAKPLFCSTWGKISRSQCQRIFRKHAQKAGIKTRKDASGNDYIGIHSLRHSAGCTFARHGLSTDVIQKRLGHKSITSTQIYLTLESKEEKERQRKANEVFNV